jgi:2-C-methyl-D-erythritol 2,4-cyclodiphosphate synthase
MIRIGHGYDVHAFEAGDHIVLGGVRIPHSSGLKAHSDGDVLIHALCDALLGAAGLGDIGRHFPDSDPRYQNINSRKLLCSVAAKLKSAGFTFVNADLTVVAQLPRLAEFVDTMCENISADLGAPCDVINVKATTTERLGFIGREEGIEAHAVALIDGSTAIK